jgi:hypothetical protein
MGMRADAAQRRDAELGTAIKARVWLVSAAAAGLPLVAVDGDTGSASVAVARGVVTALDTRHPDAA